MSQVLGARYSTLGGWQRNVDAPLWQAEILPPAEPSDGPASCGV